MKLEDIIKKIDLNFINKNFNGKIKLELHIDEECDDGYFYLTPIGFHDLEDSGFETVLSYLFSLVGGNYDNFDREDIYEYYDRQYITSFGTGNTTKIVPLLENISNDFYLDVFISNSNSLISFEDMECMHNWKNKTKLTKSEVQNLINYYNSNSKYFEIITIINENSDE